VTVHEVTAAEDPRRIQEAERLLRSVVDSLDGRMCILASDGTIVGTNRLWNEFAARRGWTGEESGTGADFFGLIGSVRGELAGRMTSLARAALLPGADQSEVKGYLPTRGRTEHVVVRMHPIRDHDVARLVVTIIDITEATRTQNELLRITDQAQLLALVAEHTDNAVVIADVDGRIEWANEAFCRMSGYAVEELVGTARQDMLDGPFSRTPAFRTFAEAVADGRPADVQMPIQSRDGRTYWVHLQVKPIVEDGRPVRFISIERDVTVQRNAEEQLRAATRQARLLAAELSAEKTLLTEVLRSIPHLVYWKDAELRYTGVNPAFLSLRGLAAEDLVLERTEGELTVADQLSDELARIEPEVLATGEAVENRRLVLTVAGRPSCSLLLSVLPQTDEDGKISGVIGVAADVTHVTTLEQQLAQATRLESIGQLAAGIAHEINTPVQYVADNIGFLIESFGEVLTALRTLLDRPATGEEASPRAALGDLDLDFLAEEIPSALAQSKEGLARIAQIVRAMKDFSHPGQGRADADLNRAVESTVQVSRNEWRYVCEVELDLSPDLPPIACYEGELKQVLLNIVVNAAQAIATERERTGSPELGQIRIATSPLEDGGARITVGDDGPGMTEDVRQKIFDPFFTTKPVGKGTGQGLSMAYAVIVQKHGGRLAVTSSPGAGATFTIDLPTPTPS
jgi:two-component system NtrC family sensor kinase